MTYPAKTFCWKYAHLKILNDGYERIFERTSIYQLLNLIHMTNRNCISSQVSEFQLILNDEGNYSVEEYIFFK